MFLEKVKWRSKLQCDGDMPTAVRIKRNPQPCNQLVEPEVSAWCRHFRERVLRAADVGARTGRAFNTSRLFMWGLR